ncbi:MAG: FAD-dependent oxidoreductase [Pseudomonadota bacterium]
MTERQSYRLAIVGGGPAGLSLARMLSDTEGLEVTVFEREPMLGGKSHSLYNYARPIELGTSYTAMGHRIAKKWMKELGITLRQNGESRYDGKPFIDYVKDGSGKSFALQMLHFMWSRRRLLKKLKKDPDNDAALAEASLPVEAWLKARGLRKIERFMHRILTTMGYGVLDEVSTIQALRWIDVDLLLSGQFNQIHAPEQGWTEFWKRVADGLTVETDAAVTAIKRDETGVTLTVNEEARAFDGVVCAAPFNQFASVVDPNEAEAWLNKSFDWTGYASALVAVEKWFEGFQIDGYSDAARPGAEKGKMLGARYEADAPDLGGRLFITGQIPGDYSESELQEILEDEIRERGGENPKVIMLRKWIYFAQWRPEAIRGGLLTRMDRMQGQDNTWYTGALFSFESISHIMDFNARLAPRIIAAVKR